MKCLLALSLLFLISIPVVAAENPQALAVVTQKRTGAEDVFVQNLEPCDVTVTFEVSCSAARVDRSMPYTVTLPPHSRQRAFTVNGNGGRWHYQWHDWWIWGTRDARHRPPGPYLLPYPPSMTCKVTQGFHGKMDHHGDQEYAVDFAMPVGTEVRAARAGEVVLAIDCYTRGAVDPALLSQGNQVLVKHDDGTYALYLHLEAHGIRVRPGQRVAAGQVLALSGNTGFTSGPHLHFMVFRALDGHHRESYPVEFLVDGKGEAPVQGRRYTST